MPPKSIPSKIAKPQGSNKEAIDAINSYLSQKPDLDEFIRAAKENPTRLRPEKRHTDYDLKIKEAVREVLEERRQNAAGRSLTIEMPSHPKDSAGSASDQSAKDSASSKAKATVMDHQAAPGPVITAENLGQPASKEELRKRAEELNKK